MDDEYLVTYTNFYGVICMIVRAPNEEWAIDKAKQEHPIDEEYPPTITVKLLDHVLSDCSDVITLARYVE